MIRGTTNGGIMSASKLTGVEVGPSESWEHVSTTAGAKELRDIDAREVGQTVTPSNRFNGTAE